MTEEIKNTLIEKMIDRPEELTSDEIMAISRDEELRELYEVSAKLQSALQPLPQTNVTEEWENFSRRVAVGSPRRRLYKRIMPIAAVVAGISLVTAVAVDFIMKSTSADTSLTTVAANDDRAESKADTLGQTDNNVSKHTATRGKETVHIADACGATHTPPAKKTGHTRKPTATEAVDIDKYLQIEQARIDNEVAMALAEVYENEYRAYQEVNKAREIIDGNASQGEYSTETDVDMTYINRIIMI